MDRCDVVAVNIETNKVRLLDKGKWLEDGEAICNMAVMRRGFEDEFFCCAPVGKYQDGDPWGGDAMRFTPETSADGRIVKHGDTWYPNGPRGLDR